MKKRSGSNLPVPHVSPKSKAFKKSQSPSIETRRKLADSDIATTSSELIRSPGNDENMSGVRYITEDLIVKITKERTFELITSLNLTLSKETGKKIKYIENLDKLKNLTTLNLSSNIIEKIEKLDKLKKLQDLNLSYNNLTRLDGLECLTSLMKLNVTGNLIEHVPIWIPKKLKRLSVFLASKNMLNTLSELSRLKPLPDLTELAVSNNPVSKLPHCRAYLVFHLRSLHVIDGHVISDDERYAAEERFSQGERELLEQQVAAGDSRIRDLEEEQNQSLKELQAQQSSHERSLLKDKELTEALRFAEEQLSAKNELLERKTIELNRACEKHYQLEQELAFYKIDSKFDVLGKSPPTNANLQDDSSLLEESPYIGRARYRANQYSQESSLNPGSPEQSYVTSPQQHARRRNELDVELMEKQEAIDRANQHLQSLHEDLAGTQDKLNKAEEKLRKLPRHEEVDDGKHQIRQMLAKKIQTVNDLRDAAAQVEIDLDQTQADLTQGHIQAAYMRDQLNKLSPSDPTYKKAYKEMIDKEQQISVSNQACGQLQRQLEEMLATIAAETKSIKQLEMQLNQDHLDRNEEIRRELDGIVSGLQTYMSDMKDRSRNQQKDLERLVQEKTSLLDKVANLEQGLRSTRGTSEENQKLKMKLSELQDELVDQREVNDSLVDQLHRSRLDDSEIQDRLEVAENDAKELRSILSNTRAKAQEDKRLMDEQLKGEKERAERSAAKARSAGDKERELRGLYQQLEAAKTLNQSLKDDLHENEQMLKRSIETSIPMNELRAQLNTYKDRILSAQGDVGPQHQNDVVGQTFKAIQTYLDDQIGQKDVEVDTTRKQKSEADLELHQLYQRVQKLEAKLEKEAQKYDSVRNKLDKERKSNADEVKGLHDELKQTRSALKNARDRANQTGTGPVTRVVYARETDSSDRDSLDTEEKCLLDDLQRELMELRNSMRVKEMDIAKQVEEAEEAVATKEDELVQQEQRFQADIDAEIQAAQMQKERAAARTQVILADLEQARGDIQYLQQILGERDAALHDQTQNNLLSDQMIASQEEEIGRLYEILDTQKRELEKYQDMLDEMTVDPTYDVSSDELQRLRNQVTSLKEALALQNQYLKKMKPAVTTSQSQTTGDGRHTRVISRGETELQSVPPEDKDEGTHRRRWSSSRHGVGIGGDLVDSGQRQPIYIRPGETVPFTTGTQEIPLAESTPPRKHPSSSSIHTHRKHPTSHHHTDNKHGHASYVDRKERKPRSPYREQIHANGSNGASKASSPDQRTTRHPLSSFPPTEHLSRPRNHDHTNLMQANHNQRPPQIDNRGQQFTELDQRGTTQQPVYVPEYQPNYQPPNTQSRIHKNLIQQQPRTDRTRRESIPQNNPIIHANNPTMPQYVTELPSTHTNPNKRGHHKPMRVYSHRTRSPRRLERSRSAPHIAGPNLSPPLVFYPLVPQTQPQEAPPVAFIPISPIRRDTSPIMAGNIPGRGIRRHHDDSSNGSETDDSSLFCNVPEHHDLEDYVYRLQEQVKDLRERLNQQQIARSEAEEKEGKRMVKQLLTELEERREELEGLDLAIERQKREMKKMHDEERQLTEEVNSTQDELDLLRQKNNRSLRRKKLIEQFEKEDEMEDMDYEEAKSRQKELLSEIQCLEKTLRKRKIDLDDTMHELNKCREELKDAREQARDTVRRYDDASSGLQRTMQEASEIEQRANDTGVQLVKATEQLNELRSQLKDTESKKAKQQKILSDVNQIVSAKDGEFRDIDARIKQATTTLQQLQSQVVSTEQKERQSREVMKEMEESLGKRRSELTHLRDQAAHRYLNIGVRKKIEAQKSELEKVDQLMGRKRTELQLLQESVDRKESELNQVMRDADNEISSKQRDIKEKRDILNDLDQQTHDLDSLIKVRRAELQQLKSDIEVEEEVLQKLTSGVNRNKSELKHTHDMIQIEKTELENIKGQHAQRLSELERTQRAYMAENSELESVNAELTRKQGELERLHQLLEREKADVECLRGEKRKVEDDLAAITREKVAREEACKQLDNRSNEIKRTHSKLEGKLETGARKLEVLEKEVTAKQGEVDELREQTAYREMELENIKLTMEGSQDEVRLLKEELHENQQRFDHLENEYRETYRKREEAKLEIEQLNEAIRASRGTHDEVIRQERKRKEMLDQLEKEVGGKEREHDLAADRLRTIQNEVEREQTKLSRVVNSAKCEVDALQADINRKRDELQHVTQSIQLMQMDAERRHHDSARFEEMAAQIKCLDDEVARISRECDELRDALQQAQADNQKSAEAHSLEREDMMSERARLLEVIRDLESKLQHTRQEMGQLERRSTTQVTELEKIAQDHFNRASQLTSELSRLRRECGSPTPDDLRGMVDNKENEEVVQDMPAGGVGERSKVGVLGLKRDALKQHLIQEQNYLRQQLQQQMSRHADTMEFARLKSEGTIDNLRKKLTNLQQVLLQGGDSAPCNDHLPHSITPYRPPTHSPTRLSYYSPTRTRSRSRSQERRLRARSSSRDASGVL